MFCWHFISMLQIISEIYIWIANLNLWDQLFFHTELYRMDICITYIIIWSVLLTFHVLPMWQKFLRYILIVDSNLVVKWSNNSLALEKDFILVPVHIIFCWVFCWGMDSVKWYSYTTPLVPQRTRGCYDYDNMYDT